MIQSIRQMDEVVFSPGNSGSSGFFGVGFDPVQVADGLVVLVNTSNIGNHVLTMTDDHNNTYRQVPGARIADATSGRMLDIWYSNNVGGAQPVVISVTWDGPASICELLVYDVTGITGSVTVVATKALATSGLHPTGVSLDGSLNGEDSNLYIEFIGGPFANGATVAAPWNLFSGPAAPPSLTEAASLISSGVQQPTFTLSNGAFPLTVTGVLFYGGDPEAPGGGGIPMALPAVVAQMFRRDDYKRKT